MTVSTFAPRSARDWSGWPCVGDVQQKSVRSSSPPIAHAIAWRPGVSTTSEVVALLERGITEMKFFPAEAAGGTAYLKALSSPLPQARFCPTGGINPERAKRYLSLPNVVCVGGSWLVPKASMAAGDWRRITELARETFTLQG